MNAPHSLLAAALLAASTVAVHAQGGSLTPPAGPPVATMKSLDIVEPRIPLVSGSPGITVNGTSGTITISQAGSYYLTKNLQVVGDADGIVINSSNVTLDLMGYAVLSPASGLAGSGIMADGNIQNITIRNGHIRSTTTQTNGVYTLAGFSYGVFASGNTGNVRVENISVRGASQNGIYLAEEISGSVLNCSVHTTGDDGISNKSGIVHNSTTLFTGGLGIYSLVSSGCTVSDSFAEGMQAYVVINCSVHQIYTGTSSPGGIGAYVVENSSGITHQGFAISGQVVLGSRGISTSTSTSARGIVAEVVTASLGVSSGGHGISAISASQCYGDSYGSGGASSHGISAQTVSFSRGNTTSISGGSAIFAAHSVTGSYGESAGQHGIDCQNGTVTGSYGKTTRNTSTIHGIRGVVVSQSVGEATGTSSGHGIESARSVTASYGVSGGFNGIDCPNGMVASSFGRTTRNASAARGIRGTVVSQSAGEATGTTGGHGIEGIRSVTGSYGYSEGWRGIFSDNGTVSDSYGYATGSSSDDDGINAQIVANCRGQSTGGAGIQANTLVQNSSGTSATSHGINVLRSAQNCYGFTTATVNTAHGIFSQDGNVSNCWGWSIGNGGGSGIKARIVISSNGIAVAGALHGIDARIVESSYGSRDSSVAGRFGIVANRASLSEAVNGESITNKYNMP